MWKLIDAGATEHDPHSRAIWDRYLAMPWFLENATSDRGDDGSGAAIALFDDVEIDRIVRPSMLQLFAWLHGIVEGERRHLDDHRDDPDARELRERAVAALRAARFEEATAAYVENWERPSSSPVRHTFIAGEIGELVAAYPPARGAFEALRDRAEPREGARLFDVDGFHDWCALNRALGDDARTLAWFEAHPRRYSWPVENTRLRFLENLGRWREAGLRYEPELILGFVARTPWIDRRDQVARMLRALRAADRTAEADDVEARLRELRPGGLDDASATE